MIRSIAAAVGADMEARNGGVFWYWGNCHRRHRNGDYHRVARWRCG